MKIKPLQAWTYARNSWPWGAPIKWDADYKAILETPVGTIELHDGDIIVRDKKGDFYVVEEILPLVGQ